MPKTWMLLLGYACAFNVGANDAALPDPVTVVGKMHSSIASTSYRATVAYLKEGRLDTLELVHAARKEGAFERIVSLNGTMREVVRDGGKMMVFTPENKTVIVENEGGSRYFLLDFPTDAVGIDQRYHLRLEGKEKVLQREAWQLVIEPRDDLRFERRIWVDESSGLPLKYELIDEHHQLIEQMMFTQLELQPAFSPADLKPLTHADGFRTLQGESRNLSLQELNWTLRDVPSGFVIKSYARVQRPPLNRPIEHILLSDGLSSVSVYIDKVDERLMVSHARKMGALNVFTRVVDGFQLTILGEVPAKTVESIANGIHHRASR